jgi:hypothetical protein
MTMRQGDRGPAGTIATGGPPRDHALDLVRLLAAGVMIIGHWLITVVRGSGDDVYVTTLLEVDRPLAWVLQVLPAIFFLAGGAVHTTSWRRAMAEGTGYADWLRRRAARLLRPVLPLVWLWTVLPPLLLNGGADWQLVRLGAEVSLAPLWFLANYLAMIALLPALLWLQGRMGWWLPALLLLGAVGFDVLVWTEVIYRIYVSSGADLRMLQTFDVLFVWGVPLVLGIRMADGVARGHAGRLIAVGTAILVPLLALSGPPDGSIAVTASFAEVGQTSVHAALSLIVAGVICAVRGPASHRLDGGMVTRLGAATLPAYLWHGTVLVGGIALVALSGVRLPSVELSAGWWAVQLLWLAGLAGALIPFVAAAGWLQRRATATAADAEPEASGGVVVVATAAVVVLLHLFLRRGVVGVWAPVLAVLLTLAAGAAGALDGPLARMRRRQRPGHRGVAAVVRDLRGVAAGYAGAGGCGAGPDAHVLWCATDGRTDGVGHTVDDRRRHLRPGGPGAGGCRGARRTAQEGRGRLRRRVLAHARMRRGDRDHDAGVSAGSA